MKRSNVVKMPAPKLTPDEAARVVPPINGNGNGKGTDSIKTPATEADYLAVLLHQALDEQNGLRQRLLTKEQENLNLRVDVAKREARIYELENAATEARMDALRRERGMKMGRRINRNDETGEITWEDVAPVAPAKPEATAPAEMPPATPSA